VALQRHRCELLIKKRAWWSATRLVFRQVDQCERLLDPEPGMHHTVVDAFTTEVRPYASTHTGASSEPLQYWMNAYDPATGQQVVKEWQPNEGELAQHAPPGPAINRAGDFSDDQLISELARRLRQRGQ